MQRYDYESRAYCQFDFARGNGLLAVAATRHGGVSPAPFASLNLSVSKGDSRENVRANLARLVEPWSVAIAHVVGAWLVHGNRVGVVHRGQRGERLAQCDALITAEPEVPLLMTFADCVPVVLYDARRHVLGLVHAGWQGTVQRVTEAAVLAMQRTFSTNPADLRAGIGPSIGPCCYEVGAEVAAQVHRSHHDVEPLLHRPVGRREHLDLWTANQQQLQDCGVEHIERSDLCTSCHTEDFYSHRAERGETGRFGVLAMLHA